MLTEASYLITKTVQYAGDFNGELDRKLFCISMHHRSILRLNYVIMGVYSIMHLFF